MLNDICLKEDVLLSLQFAGSNVTMPYAEIGASLFNNSRFGLLLWEGCFCCFESSHSQNIVSR